MANGGQDNPGIRIPPPLIYLVPLVSGLELDRRCHIPFLPPAMAPILGWGLVGSGTALLGSFYRTMLGTGTPLRTDEPVPRLNTSGAFRYSRNPGYLSAAMIYAGIAARRNAGLAILPLPIILFVIQREVIGREESYLERTFGEEYLNYKARVRRWV